MTGDTIDPASELVLLDNMNIPAGQPQRRRSRDRPRRRPVRHGRRRGHEPARGRPLGGAGPEPASTARSCASRRPEACRRTTRSSARSGAISCATAGIGAPTTATCTRDLRLRPAQPVPLRVRPEHERHALLHQRRRPEHLGGGRQRRQGPRTTAGTCARASARTARRRTARPRLPASPIR